MSEEVLTRDLSNGRIHRRTLVGDTLQTFEQDNLDSAGPYEVVTADALEHAEPGELCERCFVGGSDVSSSGLPDPQGEPDA